MIKIIKLVLIKVRIDVIQNTVKLINIKIDKNILKYMIN